MTTLAANPTASAPAEGLSNILNPKSIAIIGASDNPNKIGGRPVHFLGKFGFAGKIYPINPTRPEIQGHRSYAALSDLPEAPEMAIVAVAGDNAVTTVEECAAAGVKVALVMASGFGEADPHEGKAKERPMVEAAHKAGMRIIGPNCIGTMNLVDRVYCGFGVGFKNPNLRKGPVAFVSQSGGFAYSVVALAEAEGMGFNYIVSGGNEADITTLELGADFLERPEVEVLVLYLEGVSDGKRLRALGLPLTGLRLDGAELGLDALVSPHPAEGDGATRWRWTRRSQARGSISAWRTRRSGSRGPASRSAGGSSSRRTGMRGGRRPCRGA